MTCPFCDTPDQHIHDWTDVFGYSTYGDGIWFDRFEIGGDVTGAPATRHVAYLGDLTGDRS